MFRLLAWKCTYWPCDLDLWPFNARSMLLLHRVSKNCHLFVFFFRIILSNVNRFQYFFGIRSLEKTLHQKVVNLSTSPEICHRTILWNSKKWFLKYITHRFPSILISFNNMNTVSECSWNRNCLLIFSLIASSLWRHGSVWRKSACNNWRAFAGAVGQIFRAWSWVHFFVRKMV